MSSSGGRKHVKSASSHRSIKSVSSNRSKFLPTPGHGDTVKQSSTKKPIHQLEKTKSMSVNKQQLPANESLSPKAIADPVAEAAPRKAMAIVRKFNEEPFEFERDVVLVQQKPTDGTWARFEVGHSTKLMAAMSVRTDLETVSLISNGSMDEFDQAFYSKNDEPVKPPAKRYQAKRRSSPGFETDENTSPQFGGLSYFVPGMNICYQASDRQPQVQSFGQAQPSFGIDSSCQSGRETASQPALALAQPITKGDYADLATRETGSTEEYPRFIPLTFATLENESDSLAGIPVGLLNVQQQQSGTKKQLPVYILQQRLGLMATTAQLTQLGLMPLSAKISILDTVRNAPGQVQLGLTLFMENLLTPQEKAAFPLQVTSTDHSTLLAGTPPTAAQPSSEPNQRPQFYEEQIEVFGFFDQMPPSAGH